MNGPLSILNHATLTSVEFVHNYVQLRFDGPTLTINAPFYIATQGQVLKAGFPGWRDGLCERIGKTVRDTATILDQELTVVFDDDSKLVISLKSEDQHSPEAAVLENGTVSVCVW